MARYAIVKNGRVVNIAVADGSAPAGWVLADGEPEAQIGSLYDGSSFTAQDPPLRTALSWEEFVDGWTSAEWRDISTLIDSDDTVAQYIDSLRGADVVDVSTTKMADFLAALEAQGTVGSDRSAEVRKGKKK